MKIKNIVIFVIVAIIGGIAFWKRDYLKQKLGFSPAVATGEEMQERKSLPAPNPNGNSTNNSSSNNGVWVECTGYPIKAGCKGPLVKSLQKTLNKIYKVGIAEDGYFGPQTEAVLVANGYGNSVEAADMAKLARAMMPF